MYVHYIDMHTSRFYTHTYICILHTHTHTHTHISLSLSLSVFMFGWLITCLCSGMYVYSRRYALLVFIICSFAHSS